MKQCSRCKDIKQPDEFHKRFSRPDGLQSICKPCQKLRDACRNSVGDRKIKERARKREWQHANRAKIRARKVERRLKVKQQKPSWASNKAIRAIYREASMLGHHVDHIVPLISPLVCGLHCEANLQLLLPIDNILKSNKLLEI